MRQIRRHTSTPFPRIFLKNPARWAEPPGQARTRSPSQFPGHTAIGTKALGLLFLRRKVARVETDRPFAILNGTVELTLAIIDRASVVKSDNVARVYLYCLTVLLDRST